VVRVSKIATSHAHNCYSAIAQYDIIKHTNIICSTYITSAIRFIIMLQINKNFSTL